ncbi:MAG: universal stress protein [Chitinophagales bacterium]
MSTILFPTDFSGYSENAFQYILHFADKLRAKIVFLHVIQKDSEKKSPTKKTSTSRSDMHKKTVQLMHELKFRSAEFAFKQDCEIVTEHLITEGNVVDEILKAADKLNPLMIALSTNSYNTRTSMHVGNTTATVVKRSKFPVLVIPEHAFYKQVNNIALATELDEKDEQLIYKLLITAALFKARLHVFHVEEKKSKGAMQVVDYLKLVFKYPLQIEKLSIETLQSKAVATGIERYVKQHAIDLLCMENHKAFFPEIIDIKADERKKFHELIPTLVYYVE